MKKNITILQSVRPQGEMKAMKTWWRWFRNRSLIFGVSLGILAFICLLFAFCKTAGILSIICLLCLWADNDVSSW